MKVAVFLFVCITLSMSQKSRESFIKTLLDDHIRKNHHICLHDKSENILEMIYLNKIPVKSFNASMTWVHCDLYLINIDCKDIEKLLYILPPHKPILLFYLSMNSTCDLNNKKIYEKGLAIVEILIDDEAISMKYAIENVTDVFLKNNYVKLRQQHWDPEKFLQRTGRPFIVSTFDCPPFVEISPDNIFSGVEYYFFTEATKNWPIKYMIVEKEKQRVNYFIKVVKTINMKKADMGICFLWQRSLVDFGLVFSRYMFPTCITFVVHKPTLLGDASFLFQPFQSFSWLSIVVIVLILSALYYLFNHVPHYYSGNIYMFFSVLFLALICVYHSAGMTILLNFPRFSQDYVKSFNDLVKHNILWEEPETEMSSYFANSGDPLAVGISKNFRQNSDKELMNKRLRSGRYALLVKLTISSIVAETEDLDEYGQTHLRLLPGCLALFYSSVGLPRNSPLIKYFDANAGKYFETGLIRYWEALTVQKPEYRYMANFKEIYVDQMKYQVIDMKKLSGIFYFLIFGYVISFLVFLFELSHNKQ
ncbi:hypothetical protein GWI33_008821 [Rhynchophorus ferrugineus]|uniref:Ionotropic receptor n=1 Tax=Rhynchophorus ferrugineus TaxID=354439 RepID=A0A834IC95_RHYFE|nr:hypothetical protein GWI33_008821 [Rhynchophorus ferrugineus]